VQVSGNKSPYDGDFTYWATRRGKYLTIPTRTATLLKHQQGRCQYCQLYFKTEDVIETHHRNCNHKDNKADNLVLLHGHCHDEVHRRMVYV
jgi:RNA-directed DNA polymerase